MKKMSRCATTRPEVATLYGGACLCDQSESRLKILRLVGQFCLVIATRPTTFDTVPDDPVTGTGKCDKWALVP